MGGEAYIALAMEGRLWRAFRSFPRRTHKARFPPEAEVPVLIFGLLHPTQSRSSYAPEVGQLAPGQSFRDAATRADQAPPRAIARDRASGIRADYAVGMGHWHHVPAGDRAMRRPLVANFRHQLGSC
jgi:hypothetical protein